MTLGNKMTYAFFPMPTKSNRNQINEAAKADSKNANAAVVTTMISWAFLYATMKSSDIAGPKAKEAQPQVKLADVMPVQSVG